MVCRRIQVFVPGSYEANQKSHVVHGLDSVPTVSDGLDLTRIVRQVLLPCYRPIGVDCYLFLGSEGGFLSVLAA